MTKSRRIIITGFMGSGKTTVAEALANRLGCHMIDLDSFITRHESRTPAEIIEHDGEAAFRDIETVHLRHLLEKTDAQVIALGGGTWTFETNRELVTRFPGLTVWLDAPFELCWHRIQGTSVSGKRVRPLAPDRESARQLYERRRASYELAAFKVELGGNEDADIVAAQIQTWIESLD
ncbi:MAG TPA: shikimate kinase [Pyrinomonadaceae bacterium]|jgi:shikimate kinase